MRVLTTGSSGFIGSQLLRRLSELDWEVRPLKRNEWSGIYGVVKNYQPDYIFHLAAYGNRHDQEDVFEIYEANTMKLLRLLNACEETDYKAFINVGTSSEYGIKDKAMNELDRLDPDTFYAASKVAGTLLSRVWAIQHDRPIVTLRPFSLYGQGEGEHKLIPILTKAVFGDKKVSIAPGVHDWTHIDDFIDAMILMTDEAKNHKGEVFNVGTGIQYSNAEVSQMVQGLSGVDFLTRHVKQLRSYDTPLSWVADTEKIRDLGWYPKIELKEGIERYIKWYTPPGV